MEQRRKKARDEILNTNHIEKMRRIEAHSVKMRGCKETYSRKKCKGFSDSQKARTKSCYWDLDYCSHKQYLFDHVYKC